MEQIDDRFDYDMNDEHTGNTSKNEPTTDWSRLYAMSDEELHEAVLADPDVVPTDEAFWSTAKVVFPTRKVAVTMRLDADLLEWFREERGYQTHINAILRAYMGAHQAEKPARRNPAPRGKAKKQRPQPFSR